MNGRSAAVAPAVNRRPQCRPTFPVAELEQGAPDTVSNEDRSGVTGRVLRLARIDLSERHRHPLPGPLVAATASALAGSLLLDALFVLIGTDLFPSTRGYVHFRFGDYAGLTVIGVLAAGAAWPVVALVSPAPRWLFLRLAVVVTVVLWIPDLVLLVGHQPARAVTVLMAMHLAVAVVTYNCLVRMAPATARPTTSQDHDPDRPVRQLAAALAALVGVEFVLGVVTLASLPTGRPTAWVPPGAVPVYAAHALVGLPLAAGAGLLVARVRRSSRILHLTAWIGGVGVVAAGAGGMLTVSHPLRLVGIGLMLLGPVVAGFGYLLPVLDRMSEDDASPP